MHFDRGAFEVQLAEVVSRQLILSTTAEGE